MIKENIKNSIFTSSWQNPASVIARLLLGGILTYAGFSKAVGPIAEFAAVIDAYRILPTFFVLELAPIIPWIELYTGLFIIFGYFLKISARVAAFLFGIFITILLISVLRGIDPGSCGCFGEGLTLSLPQAIMADGVLFTFSCFLMKVNRFWTLDEWINKGR